MHEIWQQLYCHAESSLHWMKGKLFWHVISQLIIYQSSQGKAAVTYQTQFSLSAWCNNFNDLCCRSSCHHKVHHSLQWPQWLYRRLLQLQTRRAVQWCDCNWVTRHDSSIIGTYLFVLGLLWRDAPKGINITWGWECGIPNHGHYITRTSSFRSLSAPSPLMGVSDARFLNKSLF